MKADLLSTCGRMAFAVAITGFGTLCLAYTDFVSALQPVPASMPAYSALAMLTGVVLLATGLAVLVNRGTRLAAPVLIVLFVSWILFLHLPSAFLQPQLLRSPWWIRTFETLALTGGALILAAHARTPVPAERIRRGRIAYGIALPVFGVLHLIYPASVAALVPPWFPFPMFWAWFTGFAQIAGGVAIASGVVPKLAATLAGVMYGTWALTLHIPRSWCRAFGPCEFMPEVVGLRGSRGGLTSLFVAIGMCGAAWIVAGSMATERKTHRRKDMTMNLAGILVALALGMASTTTALSAQSSGGGTGDDVARDVERVRSATAAFRSIDAAVAAGYSRNGGACVESQTRGAMGFHHVNEALLDDRIEIERPEMLIYERLPDGTYRLNGVEYIVPFSARPATAEPPAVMGQPLKPEPRLDLWYRHVWVWLDNPSGLFADWNPRVQCGS